MLLRAGFGGGDGGCRWVSAVHGGDGAKGGPFAYRLLIGRPRLCRGDDDESPCLDSAVGSDVPMAREPWEA